MGEILFLAHRIPFLPDRGDKIRSHNLLAALRKLAPVHVACFGDTDGDFVHEALLRDWAASYCLIRRSKSMVRAGAEALLSGKAVSVTAFDHPAIHRWVRQTIAARNISTIVVFSGQMGHYVPDDFAGRVVIDLCDVDSAKFEAYANDTANQRRWVDAREGRLLSREEARLAARADTVLLVSEAEAALFASRLDAPQAHDIRALRNGIDCAFFDPTAIASHPILAQADGPNFVFTGQMDYAPNIGAALRFMDRVLPAIRAVHPGAMFHLVGRAPVAKLLARDGEPGIRVWGEVPDVRPFLAGADFAVAPLEIARGVQNKVLEAMAMARPVILSPEAATGIDAQDGRDFMVAQSDNELVSATLQLVADGAAALNMGASARRYVLAHQSWDAMMAPLAQICGFGRAADGRNAA